MILTIAEIADIHFGALLTNTMNLYDHLCKYFIERLKSEKPDIIAICGDLFHMKLSLSSTEAILCNKFINELIKTFPDTLIILIRGTCSHDLNQLDNYMCLASDKFRIYNTVTTDVYKGFKYLVIPEEYVKKDTYKEYLADKYDWVFFHGMFTFAGNYAAMQGASNRTTFTTSDFENIVSGKVVGGHIHIPLTKDKVQYCGSFERWKFGEEEPKGFRLHRYDTEKKKVVHDEFIPNEGALVYKTIKYSDIDSSTMEALSKAIESNISSSSDKLRITISASDSVPTENMDNLIAVCSQYNSVKLFKDKKLDSAANIERDAKEEENRANRISEYNGLDFYQITIKFAKDNLNVIVTDKQIDKALNE